MLKRKMLFFELHRDEYDYPFLCGNTIYNTETHWTLSKCVISPAVQKVNHIDIPGANGSIALTLGDKPVYESRTITATLECSDGSRSDRIGYIDELIRKVSGRSLGIALPDDISGSTPLKLMSGLIAVNENYNDLAHCSVTITAMVNPYKQWVSPERVEIDDTTNAGSYDNKSVDNSVGGTAAQLYVIAQNLSGGSNDSLRLWHNGSWITVDESPASGNRFYPLHGVKVLEGSTVPINKYESSVTSGNIYIDSVGSWSLAILIWRESL